MRGKALLTAALVAVEVIVAASARVPMAIISSAPRVTRAAMFEPFPECNPFGDLGLSRHIDSLCGLDGDESGNDADKAQDRVKNNLCACQDSDPVTITRFSFDQLQKNTPSKSALPWGRTDNIPASDQARMTLHDLYTTTNGDNIGESSYVQFVAYILEAHFGSKETVNCKQTHRPDLDIHIALVTDRPSTLDLTDYNTECSSVTAEMIPHRRPIAWESMGNMQGNSQSGEKLSGAQDVLANVHLADRPVRRRGQLMFDASHSICSGGTPAPRSPARRAGWEIHPIYSLDVCSSTSLTACKAENDHSWTPLDQWLKGEEGG